MILDRGTPLLEQHLIKEQAGFPPGKSCTSKLLNLTQHIEDGYQRGMITNAAFVDLTVAYDTVNHRILIQMLYHKTQDSQLCRVHQKMFSNSRFYVELNNELSRLIIQKNGLPHGSVLSPILFNIYTNDQPLYDGTRSFIYADNIYDTVQYSSFAEVERTIGDALDKHTPYYRSNSRRANLDKTQVTAFHYFEEKRGKMIPKSGMKQDRTGEYPQRKYLGVNLDWTTGYKQYLHNTKMNLTICNNLLRKLSNSKLGVYAGTIRTTALALSYSVAECAALVWTRSFHAQILYTKLNSACRAAQDA